MQAAKSKNMTSPPTQRQQIDREKHDDVLARVLFLCADIQMDGKDEFGHVGPFGTKCKQCCLYFTNSIDKGGKQ